MDSVDFVVYVHNDGGVGVKSCVDKGDGFKILLKLCGCPLAGNRGGRVRVVPMIKGNEGRKYRVVTWDEVGWEVLGQQRNRQVWQF